jgi:palmitoyltransferase
LGNNPLLWLWPSRQNTSGGDGLSYPVPSHIDPQSQYLWPPRDPDDLRPSIFSSKYKRQQERKQQQRLNQHNSATNADVDGADDSEDYYDSGSCVTDSEDEYSLTDEEQHMNKFVSNSVYNLAGVIPDDNNNNDRAHHRTKQHQHLYRSSPSFQSSARTPQLSYPDDDSSDNDDDDTIPLSSLLTTRSPPAVATKAIKED